MTTILVVDDSSVDRRLAGGILEKNSALDVQYATNGAAALETIAQRPVDLVVTDLQMPEMNGLELVEAIRAQYPLIPVILMTAHGSEEIAVTALQRGAASYVAKANLARDLLDTADNILAIARADRRHDRLMTSMIHFESIWELENDSALFPPIVDYIQDLVSQMRLCDETGRIRVGIALEEALLNALYHGNLEMSSDDLRAASTNLLNPGGSAIIGERAAEQPYCDRRVHVRAQVTAQQAEFVIRDEGKGFDPESILDPTDPANLERESGRGLMLMRTFMDDVTFNDSGTEVTLIKLRDETADS